MDDLNSVLYYGAAGIGLLRSEFQYLGRENYPRENELFLAYKKIAETMGEKLTVIRTADLGADKQAEYLNIPDETNPIMGNRGIRLCLDRKRMFKAQLRAIFRASAYGNLALMYPMISSEEEMDEIEEIIREVKIGLDGKAWSGNLSRKPESGHSCSQQPDAVHPQCDSWAATLDRRPE